MALRGGKAAVSAEDSRYWRHALFGVFAITLARLFWLVHGGTDLYPDEAQYWLWSLHPAWGYYSKPPLLAGLSALSTYALGDSEAAIRLAPPLLHFGTALAVFHIGKRLYDARAGFWSALAYATLPGVSVSAALISTDAPLLLAWALALYAFIRAREAGGGRWWYAVGAAAGLGLLAKYAMAYWLLSALLYLVLFRAERRHLTGYAKATALALLIYLPNFVWNFGHGFVSYRHTEQNAASHGPLINPMNFVEFFASQFGVFGPVFFVALLLIVLNARKSLAPRPATLLAAFALPTLAMMLVVSFISHAQPNWSAPAYVSATVLVAAWLVARGRAPGGGCVLGPGCGPRAGLRSARALRSAAPAARLERARFGGEPAAATASRSAAAVRRPRGHGDPDLLRLSPSLRRAQMERRKRQDQRPVRSRSRSGALSRQGFPAGEPPSREHPAHH